jgi:hypothetical protein
MADEMRAVGPGDGTRHAAEWFESVREGAGLVEGTDYISADGGYWVADRAAMVLAADARAARREVVYTIPRIKNWMPTPEGIRRLSAPLSGRRPRSEDELCAALKGIDLRGWTGRLVDGFWRGGEDAFLLADMSRASDADWEATWEYTARRLDAIAAYTEFGKDGTELSTRLPRPEPVPSYYSPSEADAFLNARLYRIVSAHRNALASALAETAGIVEELLAWCTSRIVSPPEELVERAERAVERTR